MVLTIALGLFEPDGLHPEFSSAMTLSTQSAETRIPPAVRGGHTGASVYSDTTRSRKLHSVTHVPLRFENAQIQSPVLVIQTRSILSGSRPVWHVYLTMDHPASSPSRWLC